LSGCQDLFLYHPSTDSEETLLARAAAKGLEPWPQAGEGRMGWYAPPPAGEDAAAAGRADPGAAEAPGLAPPGEVHRVIVFHGNGGQSVDRDHFVRGFQSDRGQGRWEVYLLEYPGFGSRPGDPSEEALLAAASEAVAHLLAADPARPVYVVGESLGTGVASQVAAANPEAVPALLLITPFTNVVDVGARTAPRFLVRLVLRDRYDSELALTHYDGRVGVLLAGQDRVVPTDLGRRLYEGYQGPKRLWVQEQAGHNTLDYDPASPFWEELTRFFLGSCGAGRRPGPRCHCHYRCRRCLPRLGAGSLRDRWPRFRT
jgi:hypothetical protein